jgi:predicted acylesterase/phospholipase RssA
VKVQIAFQGGGAKLVELLAAGEAIEAFENAKKLEVSRVSGTSAGAIVACLLATKKPLKDFRYLLRNEGAQYLNRLELPSKSRIVWRALRGKPLLDESALAELLSTLFRGFPTIDSLPRDAFIVAANLTTGQEVRYTRGQNTPLVSALLDSCGIPFMFRAPNNLSNNQNVDGGICRNLPTELLSSDPTFGPVLAVSFLEDDRPKLSPANFAELAMAVMNTAISNSIWWAKADLKKLKGSVHEISSEVGTFDFAKALHLISEEASKH